jgi:hypothetical protein
VSLATGGTVDLRARTTLDEDLHGSLNRPVLAPSPREELPVCRPGPGRGHVVRCDPGDDRDRDAVSHHEGFDASDALTEGGDGAGGRDDPTRAADCSPEAVGATSGRGAKWR